MDKEYALESAKRFLEELSKYIKIEKALLFGSWAKGKAKEGSDIDLLIISDEFEKMGFWDKAKMLGKIKIQLLEPIIPKFKLDKILSYTGQFLSAVLN